MTNFESHPASYLGPGIASLFIEAIETGFLINQLIRFLERVVERERLIVRLLVAFVTSVAL